MPIDYEISDLFQRRKNKKNKKTSQTLIQRGYKF
jgi:hypothetical protein